MHATHGSVSFLGEPLRRSSFMHLDAKPLTPDTLLAVATEPPLSAGALSDAATPRLHANDPPISSQTDAVAQPGTKGRRLRSAPIRIPSIIFAIIVVSIAALSTWYLIRPEPLLLQGEIEATRLDIAARVDGRVGNVPAGAVLVRMDNPETMAKLKQAQAAKQVAEAQLANIDAGTRREVIAARKATYERAQAGAILAQKTYDRTRELIDKGFASRAQFDQATDSLREAQKATEQAQAAFSQAVNGYTREERQIALANVQRAIADIESVQSIVDQMTVYAPVSSQVYQRNIEPGEYVSPGVPLIDLNDTWAHFDLREDLVRNLKTGERFEVRVPALGDRRITVEVKLVATKGEYASWRATRSTGKFDLRTFALRAYPVERVPELRPGMSIYTDWRAPR
jgi:HlyD family secretion protein